MHYVTPKKRLGQHFLKDQNIAQKIVASIQNTDLPVLEVGPGTGVLTKLLIEKKINFKAFDVDEESITFLKSNYPEHSENFLLHDFLKENITEIYESNVVVLGNFPYNISSQIFFKVLENRQLVDEVVCMVQKEVAQRICEGPGSKTYGILSVLLQAFYEPKYLFTVSESVFIPPPKVKSAVMTLQRNQRKNLDCDEKTFIAVVKKGFNQRRKTLRNSLKGLELVNVDKELLSKRPEQLSVEEFVYIAQHVKK